MDFHLLPVHRGKPPIDVPTPPYVCKEKYDGGPWLSYPARRGKAEKFKEGPFDFLDFARTERIDPMPTKEKESFYQTWLYFGLIAEFMGVNSKDSTRDPTSDELLKTIYKEIVVQKGDRQYLKLDDASLLKFVEDGRTRMSPDPLARKQHYEHIIQCLAYAHPLITSVPDDFDWSIKWSIAALGEFFTVSVRAALESLKVPTDFGRTWATGFLNDEAKASMRGHGWCRSDIARAEAKYHSIQTLYVARMLDKSKPKRNHGWCTDSTCHSYQIDLTKYTTQHQEEGCSCTELHTGEESLLPSLLDGNHYPLLNFKGQADDLTFEIVKSGAQPYVAISHVWADGLGNPHANSLRKCKLDHLRKLVEDIDDGTSTTTNRKERNLIWLDTLCCPVKDSPSHGKKISIEKIRFVYEKAKHVLVLDAGLMAYESKSQDSPEIISRIFTSSWMRRLWTLQEGALAKSLYFQFADQAVSLNAMIQHTFSKAASMQYRALQPDLINETRGISAFFHSPKPLTLGDSLDLLDRSLQYRSVTVASDEPLCIATLMSLDLHAVVELESQESRMEKVWELLIAKHGGVPSQIIFFEEEKLAAPGWRWAPKTLLNSQTGLHPLNTRILRWRDPNFAIREDPHGLRVKYPGVQISFRSDYGDGRPRNPWIGAPRLPEDWIQYRSLDDRRWYRISWSKFAAINNSWKTDEERRQYNERELFPLHDIANTGRGILILNSVPQLREALFTETASEQNEFNEDLPVVVTTKLNVLLSDLGEESYLYDVVEKLALEVRAHEITDKHLELCKRLGIDEHSSLDVTKNLLANHEEFIGSTANVKAKVKEKLAKAVAEDEEFVKLINRYWGEPYQEHFWVVIRNFFRHDYIGKRTSEQQQWWID